MAEEEVKYTIPSDGTDPGSQVDIVFTYNPTANADGSFTVTGASGTYDTLSSTGAVVDSDTITGISPANTLGENDNELFISANPTTSPIVTDDGVGFTISNATDSNDGAGNVDFYDGNGGSSGSVPTDTDPLYFEDSENTSSASTVTENAVCYAAGTLIQTVSGQILVERLSVGDLVVTASGEHRPIRWLGHRTVDCRRHPSPENIMPVRIIAHAFGNDRPARDLLLSPGHSLCVDVLGEILIPASSLINGASIVQEDVATITYWHVELDEHDVILAEGMPAESYLEMGNRLFFVEAGVVDIAANPDMPAQTHAGFCRPFHNSGILVDVVRDQMRLRARQQGWEIVNVEGRSDLHLIVDGVRVDPTWRGLSARFRMSAEATDVRLISKTTRPCDVKASRDARLLGICIDSISFSDGFETRVIQADDPRLSGGCYSAEHVDGATYRWTSGCSHLPNSLWHGCEGETFLRVDLVGPSLPQWRAPSTDARTDRALVSQVA